MTTPIADEGRSEAAAPGRLEAPHRRTGRAPRVVEKAAGLGYRFVSWLLAVLPARPTWTVLGWAAQASYLLWPSKRRWSNLNFGHVLRTSPDDPAVRRMALRAYATYGRYIVELMRLPRISSERSADLIDPVGLDAIDRIRAGSRGIVFAVCHVGNNEALAAGVKVRSWPLNVVADDSTFPEIFEILRRQREAWGVHVIPWRNLREVYGVLRKGEMLALLVDWGYRPDGIPVRLFDAWTTLPAGPATLAGKTGATIVPVVARRHAGGRFFLTIDEPIRVASVAPAELLRATQAMAAALERVIEAAPDQWYNFKPIWPATAEESAGLAARAVEMAASTRASRAADVDSLTASRSGAGGSAGQDGPEAA